MDLVVEDLEAKLKEKSWNEREKGRKKNKERQAEEFGRIYSSLKF